MRAIKKVKKFIEKSPNSIEGLTFAKVILALESGKEFPVMELYKLNSHDFDLAIELLQDWRIDRFYIGQTLHSRRMACRWWCCWTSPTGT